MACNMVRGSIVACNMVRGSIVACNMVRGSIVACNTERGSMKEVDGVAHLFLSSMMFCMVLLL